MSEATKTNPTPKIVMENVCKSFGEKEVLKGVDLSVGEGTSMVIIGGSGSGKSVTLKCILGLMQADKGNILVDGKNVRDYSNGEKQDFMRKFGMLFQGGALFDSLPIWQNVAFGLIHGENMPANKAKDIAVSKLEAVGLDSKVAYLFPAELSGGMQKRVSLARAIATEPEIIFFDEPTTGLDPIMADVINDLIRKCVQDLGATALTITHDMASVRKIADHVSMIYDGRIIWSDEIEKLDHSGNDYVDQFIHGRAQGPIMKHAAHVKA
jgi:phospholipid/cholesterol/gamma-HCH transport system ATP-binding protein